MLPNYKDYIINEAKNTDWQLISSGIPTIVRFSGKTYPQIVYFEKEDRIIGRDNNGPSVSANLDASEISEKGVQEILNKGISKPWPSDKIIKEFLDAIKKWKK